MMVSKRGSLCLSSLVILLFLFSFMAACVEIDTDSEPPYPVRDRDYTAPEKPEPKPPWENPEDYAHVTITQPDDGAFVGPGSLTVSGRYQGPELTSFELNGRPVTINNGVFNTSVVIYEDEAVVPIVARATTTDGIVSSDRVTVFAGQASTIEEQVTNALLLDLENSGLTQLSKLLSTLLDDMDITDLFNGKLPLEQKQLLVINQANTGNIEIDLAAEEAGLRIGLLANGIVIDLTAFGFYNLYIELNGVVADLLAEIGVDENNKLTLDITESSFNIAEVIIDGPLIPSFIGDIVSLLSQTLYDLLLEDLLLDELNNLLTGLDLTITSDTFTYSILPSGTLATNRNFGLGFDTTATLDYVWDDSFQADGFLSTPSDLPVFAETTPGTGLPYGLALALNDDMLNQLMYLVAAGGTLNFEFSDPILTAELFSILFWSFENVDPEMPLVLKFRPKVAPVFVGNSNGMFLHLPGYTGQILVDRGATGPWEAMSLAVNLMIPVSLKVNADQSVSLDLGEVDIDMEIIHNHVGQANVENIESLLAEIFSGILPDLLGGLSNMSITIPEIAGVQISIADITSFGEEYDYLGLFLNLE